MAVETGEDGASFGGSKLEEPVRDHLPAFARRVNLVAVEIFGIYATSVEWTDKDTFWGLSRNDDISPGDWQIEINGDTMTLKLGILVFCDNYLQQILQVNK